MRYSAAIDVPTLEEGLQFFGKVFGFVEVARPAESYAVLKSGDCQIGLLEKAAGTKPAPGSDDVRRYERHWSPVHLDFHVDDFEQVLSKALEAGAKCEERFDAGEHPPIAFCSDPFGHGFCIMGKAPE